MSGELPDESSFASRMAAPGQSPGQARFQFTLGSLFLAIGFVACLAWLVQFILENPPVGVPTWMHVWLVILWTAVVAGAMISTNAWPYLIGGAMGLLLSIPFLLDIYLHDFEAVPLATGWACSFTFAMFANLGGGLWCLGHQHRRIGMQHVLLYAITLIALAMLWAV